jgi:hypothetical protein
LLNGPGLPDGFCFRTKNPNLGKFLEGLAMEDVGIFYGHLVHLTVFWYILWTFGIYCGNWVYFPRFGILYQEKSGNPAMDAIHFFALSEILPQNNVALYVPHPRKHHPGGIRSHDQ